MVQPRDILAEGIIMSNVKLTSEIKNKNGKIIDQFLNGLNLLNHSIHF